MGEVEKLRCHVSLRQRADRQNSGDRQQRGQLGTSSRIAKLKFHEKILSACRSTARVFAGRVLARM